MQIAGQEYTLKSDVKMRQAARGLQLCDTIRTEMLKYLQEPTDENYAEFDAHWTEFAAIAFDNPPKLEDCDSHHVLEALTGFTAARSRMAASAPSA